MADRSSDVRILVLLGALLAVATACSGLPATGGGAQQAPPPGRAVEVPKGRLSGTAWLPDGRIYFGWAPDAGAKLQIWSVRPEGGDARQLRLPASEGCRRTQYLTPYALPDGRLGLARLCEAEDVLKDRFDLVAVDPATMRVELLAPVGRDNPAAATWQRDLRRGFVAHFSDFCASIAAVTREGVQRSARPTTLDGRSWELDQDFFEPGDTDCTPRGRATLPAVTPDGRRLVFLASPESAGVGGWPRLDVPWNVYLQDLPEGQPRAVARDFVKPTGLAMAPDGRSVLVSGQRSDERGLWRVDLATGALEAIANGRLSTPSLSPDARQVVAVLTHDADHADMRIVDLRR